MHHFWHQAFVLKTLDNARARRRAAPALLLKWCAIVKMPWILNAFLFLLGAAAEERATNIITQLLPSSTRTIYT